MYDLINYIMAILGGWIIFDGLISLTYFAWIDKTLKNPLDQAVRVVRTAAGIGIVILSFMV
jgi:hypothetical protein